MKTLILVLSVLFIAGCGTYNSRNLMEITGESMTFSYGLIAVKDVDRLVMLRETNAGKGEAMNNIPEIREYMCYIDEEIKDRVEEEIKLEESEVNPTE